MNKKPKIKKITIGKLLRTYRKDLDMSVAQVSNILKVKEKDIIALERDTFLLITSHLYVVGFIESYAKLLKINNKIIKEKIKELKIVSNIDNKQYQLVNLEKDNIYSPSKETFFNAMLMFILLSLLLFSFNQFSKPSPINIKTIIDHL